MHFSKRESMFGSLHDSKGGKIQVKNAEKYEEMVGGICFEVLGMWRKLVSGLALLLDNNFFFKFKKRIVVMGLSDPVWNVSWTTCEKDAFRHVQDVLDRYLTLLYKRMKLVVTCVALKLNNQPDSYITFSHPIFIEIIFEFHKNVKNQNEHFVIHVQGCMFCLEMIITHISHSHHFMALIFFFYVMIALRILIKALLVSLHQFINPKSIGSITPENPNHRSLRNPSLPIKDFSAAWLSHNLMVQFMILLHQWRVVLSNTHPQTQTLELGRPTKYPLLSLNLPRLLCRVFDFVLVPCHHNIRPAFLILAGGLICFQHNIKPSCNQFTKDFFVELQMISTELRTKFTKNQAKLVHNLQPKHNRYQLTLVITSIFRLHNRYIFLNSEFHFVEHLPFFASLSGLYIFLLHFYSFFEKKIHSNDSMVTWALFIYIYLCVYFWTFYIIIFINCSSSHNIESIGIPMPLAGDPGLFCVQKYRITSL
ncbi:hypothetical protein VP01_4561g1 [Puccinia sorghi]|uniref:Uncharacterized protein n=1 Tax=Puccinia sorghi TaxID=27349 RepID=A0A0L6UPJ6_9BASI|nr:hypothetical protein VP01_4561g1 [Puccinia sorghi]